MIAFANARTKHFHVVREPRSAPCAIALLSAEVRHHALGENEVLSFQWSPGTSGYPANLALDPGQVRI